MNWCTALRVISLIAASPACLAQDVVLSLVPQSTVTARPGQGAADVKHGLFEAVAKAAGREDVDSCEPYGHQSSADGKAAVIPAPGTAPNVVSYSIQASASAQGGHYRTGTCVLDRRIGFTGHDTESLVRSTATATVRIQFPRGRAGVPYFVKLSGIQGNASRTDVLIGPDGAEIPLTSANSPHPIILSRPGQEYFLRTTMTATVRASGGSTDESHVLGSTTVTVDPAPLLFGGQQGGFISGGRQTPGHANVAVVLLDGLPHCTATLIARRTFITAAHCVQGHMTKERIEAGKVTVALGSVYTQPLLPPARVTAASYPDSPPLVFDRDTLRHDIAVLHVKDPVDHASVRLAKLHEGKPAWDDIKSGNVKLIFVGFGYNVINDEKVGIGIKREASWGISGFDDYVISFSVPGTNTCMGDSGGPGFVEDGQALLLAAITSGGDPACTSGFDTRVDAYLGWLKPRIAP